MNSKCKICRFRDNSKCLDKGMLCEYVSGCDIHLRHGDWDQTARTQKEKKKEAAERKLQDAKEVG